MHIYNAWLPAPAREGIEAEDQVLADAIASIGREWKRDDPNSKFSTLKWTSLINNLIKAKSLLPIPQLEELVKLGLDVFFHSSDNLFVQVRWASCLSKVILKFQKNLSLQLEWRPFYELMFSIHFKRRDFFEGIGLKQIHLDTLVVLICNCRRFFRPGSSVEIWAEFSPYLEDVVHHSSLEAVGFLSLFMPTHFRGPDSLNREWIQECLRLWDVIPDCPYWDRQWASLLGRFIKDRAFVSGMEWEPLLPSLFGHYLNIFEVPVAKSESKGPVEREVPYDVKLAFNSGMPNSAKDVAKGIVYLLRPNKHAQARFEQLVDLLEQYYHPSNGGSWTSSLEQFLRHLSSFFLKRTSYEQKKKDLNSDNVLGPSDREAFVKTVVKLIERAQYSKNARLAATASYAASGLAFVAPSIMLPFVASQFEAALLTETATHQLKSALTTLALSSRAILLRGTKEEFPDVLMEAEEAEMYSFPDCKTIIMDAMFSTLLGMDANDPPKTLATLQFYTSVMSSIGTIGDVADGGSPVLPLDWAQWLDEFLTRLFALLRHVDSSHSGDISEDTFLMQEQSLYSALLEVLFGSLTVPLFQLALKKVAKFVLGTSVPGALMEMGVLLSAVVSANPNDSVVHIITPLTTNFLTALSDAQLEPGSKVHLSPATEVSIASQLTLLSYAITNGGPALLQCREALKHVLDMAFKVPSVKINEAGERLLSSLVESLVLYYPIKQHRATSGKDGVEQWIGTKEQGPSDYEPRWHIPSQEEIQFAEELLKLHLLDALEDLDNLCQSKEAFGQEKDRLRALLLRVNGFLQGARTCLPDFRSRSGKTNIVGKAGASLGTSQVREQTAEVLLKVSRCFFEVKADNAALLLLLVRSFNLVGNYGSSEFQESFNGKHSWRIDAKNLVEPRTNFITGLHGLGKKRPLWLIIEMAYLHNSWRASQAGYRICDNTALSPYVEEVTMELLKLSLHNYADVRSRAGSALLKIIKRYPPLVKSCIPLLASSLQDPESAEHAALGACTILSSRPVLRHVAQEWSSLASFMVAVLTSSHHESIKAQTAISELALSFSVRFSGVPNGALLERSDNIPNYFQLVAKIGDTSQDTVHWRYVLMAHVGLLCLVLPPTASGESKVSEVRKGLAAKFFSGVASNLPPLRPLCLVGLLLLLHSRNEDLSVREAILPALEDTSFVENAIKNLSLDHQYSEGQPRGMQSNDLSVVNMIPSFVRHWPATRNWVSIMKGQAFSSKLANFFQRLVQECGPAIVTALRRPLEEAAAAVEERGMQAIAAEAIAGLLHSDVTCVQEAWDDWLGTMFRKTIMQANVESLPEWAACIRFAVSSKGRKGLRVPSMRLKILEALAEPLPASSPSSLVSKRLQYLLAALMELRPLVNMDTRELSLQLDLLLELMDTLSHQSPQVRQSAGKILCILCTNFYDAKVTNVGGKAVPDWTNLLIHGAIAATSKIQASQAVVANADGSSMESGASSSNTDDTQNAVKYMETVLQFVLCAMASGRAAKAMPVLVAVLPSVLSLQETSHKDMSNFARLAVYLYRWQPFYNEYITQAVSAIVSAAQDPVWRTRAAAVTFLQSFIFRHAFVLEETSIRSLWTCTQELLSDPQPEVREVASTTLAGMLRGLDRNLPNDFRQGVLDAAQKHKKSTNNRGNAIKVNSTVMGLRACVLSSPYDIPSWLPDILVALTKFTREPPPISTMVSKTFDEFKRTHADTWAYQKNKFSEDQLEILSDLSSSASYFA